ncbi:DUF2905 domain-containing protein [candidate division KSB1 bacterium]|nr:DUF2905 domain-containing protein [candidate division KSB1 bacterium]
MNLAKLFIYAGLGLLGLGLLLFLTNKLGIHLGRLPGDIVIKKGNSTLYFPVMTCILLSLLLSALIWIFRK